MRLNEFMREKFPDLELKPPLFSDWPIGIRFELGEEGKREYDSRSRAHLQWCQQRAAALFASLHPPADEIFIVIDVNDDDKGRTIKRKLRNFSPLCSKIVPV